MVLTPVMRRRLAERSKKTMGLVWLPFINNCILGNYTRFDPNLYHFEAKAFLIGRGDGRVLAAAASAQRALAAALAQGRRPPKAGGGPTKYHRLPFRNSLHRAGISGGLGVF